MEVTIMYRGTKIDHVAVVTIADKCPICGQKRGNTRLGRAYDGSKPYDVDVWENSCGHTDYYNAVYHEAITNGYNMEVSWDFDNLKNFAITKENAKAILTDIRYKYQKFKDKIRYGYLMVEMVHYIRFLYPQSKLEITYEGDIIDKYGELVDFINNYVIDKK